MLKVLIACEESQRVCTAFRELGHEAYSADIQEPSGGHPEWHILGDVLDVLNPKDHLGDFEAPDRYISFRTMDGRYHEVQQWDIIIAHPPCTYLSNAGACRLYPKKGQLNLERYQQGLEAKAFFMNFLNADCEHIAVENPIPSKVYEMPPYTQIIQPYEYGHPYTKKTCLWLKGLPKLEPTNIVEPLGGWVCGNAEIWKKQAAKGKVYGKEKDAKHRSKTFEGIAAAMAEQWSNYIESNKEIIVMIDSMEVHEAEPVKRGRWIDIYEYCEALDIRPTGLEDYYWCSECDKAEKKTSDFCPNCGARMKEE